MSKSVNQQAIDVSQTDETELAGQYHATVKATVLIDDYPVIDSFTKIEHHADFVVDIIDPCLSTELEDPQLYDMHRIFGQKAITQPIPEVRDSVSYARGNRDGSSFCGLRIFEIDYHPFLDIDAEGTDIVLHPLDKEDAGSYTVQFVVFLYAYPEIIKATNFVVTIETCEIL